MVRYILMKNMKTLVKMISCVLKWLPGHMMPQFMPAPLRPGLIRPDDVLLPSDPA